MQTTQHLPSPGNLVNPVLFWLSKTLEFLTHPIQIIREIRVEYIRPDVIAGLTVAIVMLPQAIAYALIAELPPETGIYAAVVASVVAILWGSSRYLHTGPTNTTSLLVLSTLLTVATPGTPEYLAAAGLLAVMVGIIRLGMGLARLGVLVNFVADSVVVGFTAGAGILIAVNQLQHLLRIDIPGTPLFLDTIFEIINHYDTLHWPSFAIGLITMFTMITVKLLRPGWPDALIGMIGAALLVATLKLDGQGVVVLGQLPRGLPPFANLPLLDLNLIRQLATGALAVAAIGLVEAMSIARSISAQSGERVDSNQEFVGQGMANIVTGFLSGYTSSGSFTRTAVNYASGARSALAVIVSAVIVLVILFVFAPLAAYLPRAALSGLLMLTAYKLVDRSEMSRIMQTSKGDTTIMFATLVATVIFPLEFAVLTGVLVSFGRYLMTTSMPAVYSMLPDEQFAHFAHQPEKPECPQLGIMTIVGSLYFGATAHVEDALRKHMNDNPDQRILLLRMQQVNHVDISGLHMLESLVRLYRRQGGDVYMISVRKAVWEKMCLSGFDKLLGSNHFLTQQEAIEHIFYNALEPVTCVYHCKIRAWRECQNLPKSDRWPDAPKGLSSPGDDGVKIIARESLWEKIIHDDGGELPLLVDVREPAEYDHGHIEQAQSIPMPELLSDPDVLPRDSEVILVCWRGRRSSQVINVLQKKGFNNLAKLEGGMLAWEGAGYPKVAGSKQSTIERDMLFM